LIDHLTFMKEQAKLRIKFCSAVEVRLLCALARVAA